MTIAAVVVLCLVMLVVAFVAPAMSQHPQRGIVRVVGVPRRLVAHLPGPLGRWAAKPFDQTQRSVHRSADAGRRGRSKLPV